MVVPIVRSLAAAQSFLGPVVSVVLSLIAAGLAFVCGSDMGYYASGKCGTGELETIVTLYGAVPIALALAKRAGTRWDDIEDRIEFHPVARWVWLLGAAAFFACGAFPFAFVLLAR